MANMFCKKCNTLLPMGAHYCANCGEKVTEEESNSFTEGANSTSKEKKTKYCSNCGSLIDDDRIICPFCGRSTKSAPKASYTTNSYSNSYNNNERNNVVAGLLAIFLGTLGIHKFYLGDIGMGIFYIVITCFGFLFLGIPNLILQVVVFIEGILYLLTDNVTFNENYNKNYKQ